VFRRYKAIRDRERKYIDWPDPDEGKDSGVRFPRHHTLAAQS
jgi:hypothetical protein